MDRKAASVGAANFDSVLGKATATTASEKAGGVTSLAGRMAALRRSLMESPEVRTALDSSDPAHPPVLTLDGEGKVRMESGDGHSRTMVLSGETQALARELASMRSLAGGGGFGSEAGRPRTGGLVL